jgi:hypothetical protein
MAAFETAHAAPTLPGPSIIQPPKESTLLTDQMSGHQGCYLLFGQGDDMAAIQRARYVAPQVR